MNTGPIDYLKKYINKNKLTERLLIKLGIIQLEDRYIYIDLRPDYDITPNQRDFDSYFFKNNWDFSNLYEYIFNTEIHEKKIYTDLDIEEISIESKIAKFQLDGTYADFLIKVRKQNIDELESHGFPTDLDEFELQTLRISTIDNLTKSLNYEGSFLGYCSSIESDMIPLYVYATIKSLPLVIDKFYKNLIAEAYLLFLQGNYKLSFFILFTAFESFVNFESSSQNKRGQIKQRLDKLFTEKFGSAVNHEIYSHFKDQFNAANDIRNAIAQGKNYIEISFEIVDDLFKYTLAIITAFQFSKSDFKQLLTLISKPKYF